MTHICNDCKNQKQCKEKFKESSGVLCKNRLFQKDEEERFKKEEGDYIEWVKKQ